jgi:hypothetical protein
MLPISPWISALLGIGALVGLLGLLDAGRTCFYTVPTEAQLKDNLEQVKLLFDYTKFHITVYGSLATLLLGVAASSLAEKIHLASEFLIAAVAAIIGAGLAAGIVAASMPECTGKVGFWDWKTGTYNLPILTIRSWTFVEHTSFWLSILFVVLSFYAGRSGSKSSTLEFVLFRSS